MLQMYISLIQPLIRETVETETYFFLSLLHLVPLFLSPVVFASDRRGNGAGIRLDLWINGAQYATTEFNYEDCYSVSNHF